MNRNASTHRYANMDQPPQAPVRSARSSVGAVLRSKPEALLLLAAGCALLVGVGRRAGRASSVGDSLAAAGARASHMAGSAPDRAASSLSEATAAYAQAASDGAGTVRSALPSGSDMMPRAADPVGDAFSYLASEQPLALAAMGLALGAALGAWLPSLAIENRLFGEARERVAQAATQAASDQLARLREAREAATEKLKEEAAERGLDAEGLKDLAHEVAEAAKEGAAHSRKPRSGARPAPASSGSEAG